MLWWLRDMHVKSDSCGSSLCEKPIDHLFQFILNNIIIDPVWFIQFCYTEHLTLSDSVVIVCITGCAVMGSLCQPSDIESPACAESCNVLTVTVDAGGIFPLYFLILCSHLEKRNSNCWMLSKTTCLLLQLAIMLGVQQSWVWISH